ncbi:hypothetical protein [Methylobacterium sp. ID0610]|uniref:hypothetical protein n=1 Tax=Methylobacterium carpenticola TaxID=3344827 RepID=UPI0036AA76B3
MTIEPTEFDMVALARRGLEASVDDGERERRFAAMFAEVDRATGRLTQESAAAMARANEAIREADERLARFNVLYPERAAA